MDQTPPWELPVEQQASAQPTVHPQPDYYSIIRAAAQLVGNQQPPPPEKSSSKKKQYVNKACIHCKSSHVACDAERPCKRCIRLNKADSCKDAERKKRGRPSGDSRDSVDKPPNKLQKQPVHRPVYTPMPPSTQRPILPHLPPEALQQSRLMNILQNNPTELSNLSSAEDFYNALQALSLLIPLVNNGAMETDLQALLKPRDEQTIIDPGFLKAIEQLNGIDSNGTNILSHGIMDGGIDQNLNKSP